MPSFSRIGLVAALAIACHGALAQTAVPPTLTVQQLAPQLVAFAGSESNFQNLVNGLAQGTPVQLLTVLPNGFTQVVSFTPATALTPSQVAQVLESARQQLIGLGIGSPTAEQIGFTLMGGVVPTALGGSQVAGVLNPPSPAAQIQSGAAAGATAPTSTTPAITNTVNVQLFPSASTSTTSTATTAPRNTSDSLQAAGATSRSALGTSASPPTSTSTSPPVATVPTSPGAGAASTPPTAERVPPGTPKARF
jgi:hypothetical protein